MALYKRESVIIRGAGVNHEWFDLTNAQGEKRLLFMTYNGWVMIAVAVGAGVGYFIFGAHTKATKETACH